MNLPDCWLCEDKGVVNFYQRPNGTKYFEFSARCTCSRGNQYPRLRPITQFKSNEWLKNKKNSNQLWAVERVRDFLTGEKQEEAYNALRAYGVNVDELLKHLHDGQYTTYNPAEWRYHILHGTLNELERNRQTQQGEQTEMEMEDELEEQPDAKEGDKHA